jgi:hypothetical protein
VAFSRIFWLEILRKIKKQGTLFIILRKRKQKQQRNKNPGNAWNIFCRQNLSLGKK